MRYNGVYDNMSFPTYVFREYPKWIKLKDGKAIVVDSQADELRAVANDGTEAPVSLEVAANAALAARDAQIEDLKAQLKALAVQAETPAKDVLPSGSTVTAVPKSAAKA